MRLVFVHDGPLFCDKNGKYHEFSYHGLYVLAQNSEK